jgi:hypothetical protein
MTEATKDTAKAYKLALERFNIAERERYGSNGEMERYKTARTELLKKAVLAANALLRILEGEGGN